MLKNNVVLVN